MHKAIHAFIYIYTHSHASSSFIPHFHTLVTEEDCRSQAGPSPRPAAPGADRSRGMSFRGTIVACFFAPFLPNYTHCLSLTLSHTHTLTHTLTHTYTHTLSLSCTHTLSLSLSLSLSTLFFLAFSCVCAGKFLSRILHSCAVFMFLRPKSIHLKLCDPSLVSRALSSFTSSPCHISICIFVSSAASRVWRCCYLYSFHILPIIFYI